MAFLTTRVKQLDKDDYKKLGWVIKYLWATPEIGLMLEGDDARIVNWWVDASLAIHPDMKSHTAGGTLSLGKGLVYSASTRQKLLTQKAQLRPSLLELMTLCHSFFGRDIFWTPKGTVLTKKGVPRQSKRDSVGKEWAAIK
jgi:hypothetical protein